MKTNKSVKLNKSEVELLSYKIGKTKLPSVKKGFWKGFGSYKRHEKAMDTLTSKGLGYFDHANIFWLTPKGLELAVQLNRG